MSSLIRGYASLKKAIQDYTENTETTFLNQIPNFIQGAEERIFKTVDLELFRKNVTASTTSSNRFLAVPSDYLASFSLSVTSSSNKSFLLQKDVNYVEEYNPNASTTGLPQYYALFDVDNFILAPTPDQAYSVELHYYYRPLSLVKTSITINITSGSGTFSANEILRGDTSGTTATITSFSNNQVSITPHTLSGTGFLSLNDGGTTETVVGLTSGATGTISQIIDLGTWLSTNAPFAMLYGSLIEAYTFMKGEPDVMKMYNDRFVESLLRLKEYGEARENADAYRRGLPERPRT